MSGALIKTFEYRRSRPKNKAGFRFLTPTEARHWAFHIDHFATLAPISEVARHPSLFGAAERTTFALRTEAVRGISVDLDQGPTRPRNW